MKFFVSTTKKVFQKISWSAKYKIFNTMNKKGLFFIKIITWIRWMKIDYFQNLTCLVACALVGLISAHETHVKKTVVIEKKIPVHIPVYKTVHVPHVSSNLCIINYLNKLVISISLVFYFVQNFISILWIISWIQWISKSQAFTLKQQLF